MCIIGRVKREVFEQMLECLVKIKAASRKHPNRGTPPQLSNADKLLLMLMYYREYRTQFHIAVTCGIFEIRVCGIIKETEDILVKDSRFHLPGRKALLKEENKFEVFMVDVTESPVERPKKTEAELLRQEKVAHRKDSDRGRCVEPEDQILCTVFDNSRTHDFKLFKKSEVHLKEETVFLADTGYQGLVRLHENSELPKRKSKKHPLSEEDKRRNRSISSSRIAIENIIREVKIFRIITEKYRNRRRRFALIFNLIAAVYNLNLICK